MQKERLGLEDFTYKGNYFKQADLSKPYSMLIDNHIWNMASDSHILIAVRNNSNKSPYQEPSAFLRERFLYQFNAADLALGAINYKGLLDFGSLPKFDQCTSCKGTGKTEVECDDCDHTHQCMCAQCVGYGEYQPDYLVNVINDQYLLNAFFVNKICRFIPTDETETINVSYIDFIEYKTQKLIKFSTSQWRIIIASMSGTMTEYQKRNAIAHRLNLL